jgi:hypothetical protein
MSSAILINHELKAIYFHLPKTGGSYVKKILKEIYNFQILLLNRRDWYNFSNDPYVYINPWEITKKGIYRFYRNNNCENYPIDENIWDNYYKFCFIRNPYDKIVSCYEYFHNDYKLFIYENFTKKESLLDFIKNYQSEINHVYNHSFIPQYEHLIDDNMKINIDYIGKFENLNEDLLKILTNIGITNFTHLKYLEDNIKINKNNNKKYNYYYEYYNDEILFLVNNIFEKDFKYLDYEKCNNINELIQNSNKYIINDEIIENNNKILLKTL